MRQSRNGFIPMLSAWAAAGVLVGAPAWAFPANLQMRRTAVPNSCDYSVFEPELKITNTGTGPLLLSSVYVQFGIRAGENEIEAVHPTGTWAAIFDANGGFHGFDGITVRKRFAIPDAQFAPDRRVNQIWTAEFDPPNAGGPDISIPVGGFATLIVTLRRAGGLSPFDPECDDFTKVERNSPYVFTDNRFFSLGFTSTQQQICEQLSPTTNDPNTGLAPFPPFQTGCPQ